MAQSNTAQKRLSVTEIATLSELDITSNNATLSQSTAQSIYKKLLPGEVRLLRLLPRSSPDQASFTGELVNVKISERPLYTAVSYTWNSSAAETSISIHGKPLMIRENVNEILQHLVKESDPRRLWIDSICINQSDTSERNSQVHLMGDIFAGASYVVTWLDVMGREFGNAGNELDAVAQIFRYPISHFNLDARALEASAWFFEHRYWTRRWIVQELLLARSVILTSRTTEVPLLRFIERLKSIHSGNQIPYGDVQRLRRQAQKSPFLRLFPLHGPQSGETKLADLLYVHRHARCKELTDRVYALISLSPHAKLHLDVDYSTDSGSLFIQVLDFCVKHEGLDEDGLVWLILLLRRQLNITDGKLKTLLGERQSAHGLAIGGKNLKTVVIRQRGVILRASLSYSNIEQYILDCRAKMPMLGEIDQSSWLPSRYNNLVSSMSPEDLQKTITSTEKLSGHDLFGFVFQDFACKERLSEEEPPLRLGFSTAWLEPNDEVWQFRRTPTALIMRKHKNSSGERFVIVGKAYILKYRKIIQSDATANPSDMLLDELLTYHEEAMDPCTYQLSRSNPVERKGVFAERRIMHLDLDVPTLLKLLKWVDFDY